MNNDDAWLFEAQIAAYDVGLDRSYLYVPGQLLVAAEDAPRVRADLERRGLLDGEPRRTPTDVRPAEMFDNTTLRRLGRQLGKEKLAEVLQAAQERFERVTKVGVPEQDQDGGTDLPPPGQNPDADEALEQLGLVRFQIGDPDAVPRLVTGYRRDGLEVAPNHVIHWEPFYEGSPGSLPMPTKDDKGAPKPGEGPKVMVLDTGIQREWDHDAWFGDRVKISGPIDHEVTDADRDGALDVQAGHGTFIASLIAEGCPTATIHVRRVLNSFGLTADSDLVPAILEAAKVGPDLLVLSLGCYTADDAPPPAVSAALRHLPEQTVVVAAAGNACQSRVFWPAAEKTVVAVGAHDGGSPPAPARFSNHGYWVDACADGVDVHGRFVKWDGGIDGLTPGEEEFTGWAIWSGTSFSAPIVAARLAQHMVDTGGTAAGAVRALVRPPGAPGLPDLGTVVA